MKKTLYIITVIAVSLSLTGCIKEALPQGSTQTAKQVESSEFALSGLINSIASGMSAFDAYGLYDSYEDQFDFGLPAVHLMTEYMLEDVTLLGEPGYNQFYYHYMNLYQAGQWWLSAYYWKYYYNWLKACNDSVKLLGEPSSEKTEMYLGQALAWRAYCYLDMARLYEPKENDFTDISAVKYLTVPIIDENSTEESARNNPRVTRDVIYDFILKDLDKAETLLTGKIGNFKAPTLAVVYGLKARTYIEQGYWSLEADYDKAANYKDAFAKAAEYAEKAIEASGCTPLKRDEWENPTTGFNSGNAVNAWMLGLTLDAQNTNNLCNFTAMFSSEAQFGYGPYIVPGIMPKTYEKINEKDWRRYSWMDPRTFVLDPEASAKAGIPMYVYDPANSYYQYKLSGDSFAQKDLLEYASAYMSLKFRPAKGACVDDTEGVGADHCLMRVEEMYFLKAEAEAHINPSAAVTTLENFMNEYRMLDGSYLCEAVNLKDLLDEILFQKRIEFWGEGILMFDYKRIGVGIHRDETWASSARFDTGDSRSSQWALCIPRSEIQSNNAISEALNNPDPSSTMPTVE